MQQLGETPLSVEDLTANLRWNLWRFGAAPDDDYNLFNLWGNFETAYVAGISANHPVFRDILDKHPNIFIQMAEQCKANRKLIKFMHVYKFIGDDALLMDLARHFLEGDKAYLRDDEVLQLVRDYCPERYLEALDYRIKSSAKPNCAMGHPNKDLMGLDTFKAFRQEYDDFLAHAGLDDLPLKSLKPAHVLAARQIIVESASRRFNQVVGIAKSGVHIPLCLKMMGHPAALIDFHRDEANIPPRWIPFEGASPMRKNLGRVLIFEDDAVTGTTLDAVAPEILKYKPRELWICFTNNMVKRQSFSAAAQTGHFAPHHTITLDEFVSRDRKHRLEMDDALARTQKKRFW